MACYKPLGGRQRASGRIDFRRGAKGGKLIAVPCGRCIGCRLEFSRQWALRCVHELRSHERSSWFTLTYDDENLPYGGSLVKDHLQAFYKRFRAVVDPIKIRYYSCGEYGDKKGRPHYHVCLFGFDFDDMYYRRTEDSGFDVFGSDFLDRMWGRGRTEIGDLTFETAAYTARYVCKKVVGDEQKIMEEYTRILVDGTMIDVESEFALMSRRPGIGAKHFDQYCEEIYREDECIVRGKRCKPPRFYDKLLEERDVSLYKKVKDDRRRFAEANKAEEELDRRTAREKVKKAMIVNLKRSLGEGQ